MLRGIFCGSASLSRTLYVPQFLGTPPSGCGRALHGVYLIKQACDYNANRPRAERRGSQFHDAARNLPAAHER
jgi:hypothetical protein